MKNSIDKKRPDTTLGPPPLLKFLKSRRPGDALKPRKFDSSTFLSCSVLGARQRARSSFDKNTVNKNNNNDTSGGSSIKSNGPFLYDPFAAKRAAAERDRQSQHAQQDEVMWACGEPIVIDVEVSNPTSVGIKVNRGNFFSFFILFVLINNNFENRQNHSTSF